MAQDNIKNLYEALKNDYDLGSEQDFRNSLKDANNRRNLYNAVGNDYDLGSEQDFENSLGYGNDKSVDLTAAKEGSEIGANAITNIMDGRKEPQPGKPKAQAGSHAQMVVDEYDRAAKAAGAELTGNNEKSDSEARNEANEPNRTDKPNKANEPDTPRMQFVPEAENVVMATPTAETLKKYPWLKADEAVPFDRNTGEPLHTWVDEQGNPISQRDLDVRRAKEEITGEKEQMRPAAASLQLPGGTTRGVRLDGSISGYVDNMMKQQYGDDYINKQYTTKDGRQISGTELLNETAQETYNELNDEIRTARIDMLLSDDEKQKKQLVDNISKKWNGVISEQSLSEALNDKETAREDLVAMASEEIEKARADERRIRAEMDRRGAELDSQTSPFADQTFNVRGVDSEYRFLTAELNAVQDRIRSWEAVRDSKDVGLLRGLANTAGNIRTWDLGMSDFNTGLALLTSRGEKRQELVNLLGGAQKAASIEDQTTNNIYRWAKIAGESLPFAATFMATGGGFANIGKAAGNRALRIAERKAIDGLAKNVVKNMGVGLGEVASSYLLATTAQGLGTAGDIMRRRTGEIQQGSDDNYELVNGNSWGEAIYKGATAAAIENYTEMLGAHINIGKNVMKFLPKIGMGRVSNWFLKAGKQNWYNTTKEWLSRMGVNGYGGEVLEEEIAIPLNAILVGDNPLLFGNGGLLDKDTQIDILGGMALSIAGMNAGTLAAYGTQRGVYAAMTANDEKRLNNADATALEVLGDKWNAIKDDIDNTPNEAMPTLIKEYADDETMSKEEKEAVGGYITSLLRSRGHNLGQNAVMQADEEERTVLDNNLTPEEQQNVHEDGMIHTALLYPTAENGGEPQEVFITKGNVVMRGDGTVDTEASSDAIYYKGSDGEVHMTSPDKIQSVNEPISVEEYAAAGEINEPNMPNEPNTTEGFAVGDEVNVNIGGNNYTATVQGTDGNGNVQVYYQNEDGIDVPATFTIDELRNMNRPNDEQPPMGGAGAVVEDSYNNDTEDLGDYFDSPEEAFAKVKEMLESENSTITELPDGKLRVENEEFAVTIKNNGNGGYDILSFERTGNIGAKNIPENGNIGAENISTEEESTESAGNAGSDEEEVIPKDEDGNPRYYDAPVEATIADLYDGSLDDAEVQGFIDANINEAQKKYDNVQKKAPKIGTNKAKYLEQKRKWQADVDEAKRVLDYWNEVNTQKESITHTTPQEIEAAQAELSGQNAREEYAAMNENVPTNAVAVASDFIRGAKITPESFRAETGYGTGEQRRFVGMIATEQNGGKSIDRLAEELVSYDNAELNGVTFNGDTGAAKDAILEALQGAGTRGELAVDNTAEQERYVEARRAELDAQYMEAYGMTYEDYLAYEEQNLPEMLRKYANFDEVEFYNLYADEIEQSLNARINEQGNDTTGEEPRAGGGDEVLPGEGTDNARGSEGGTEQGTEVPAGVQGTVENGAVSEETSAGNIARKLDFDGRLEWRRNIILENIGDEYSLSDEKADNGELFYQNSNGSTTLTVIPDEIFDKLGLSPVPFKLTESMGWHVFDHHAKELKLKNISDAINFVLSIINNVDTVRLGRDNSYIFSIENGRKKVGRRAVAIIVDSRTGEFMGIRTAGYESLKNIKERPLLWTRGTLTVSEDVATSPISTIEPQQSDEDTGRTKEQSNSPSSESKDTQTSSNEQTIGEKIEDKPFSIVESRRGTVSLYRGKHTKGGITYTRVVAMRNGGRVSMPTAFMPFPESMEAIDLPEGVSVLGVKELREDGKGKSEATVVVRYEDGALDVIESKLQPSEKKGLAERIATAEAETDTEPTEAQKDAGNYKKGHVKIDGFDVTIENPKGSVRSGKDADGTPWSVTMNNTYGYIRGTEGVDGDHIDVYLSDNPTEGNVFVIDQVNSDGSFDEHKVMYGFNSAEEARDAYLANYSPGWQGLGTITEVTKDEFKKWVGSSHRKTKPFAEYKSVNKANGTNEPNTPRPKKGESAVEYTRRLAEVKINNEKILADEAHEAFSEIMSKSSHNVEINNGEVSETDNTLYAPIRVDGRRTNLSLYQEEPAHSNEEPIIGVSYYREGLTYQEASDLSEEYNRHVGEDVCSDGNDELAINFNSIDEAVRFEEWLKNRQNDGVRFRKADDEISDFAQKHNLNRADVEAYADYMGRENLNGAARAFHEIRRKVRLDNQGASLGQFTQTFSPIEKELYDKFGNIDDLRQQYVQKTLDERNAMEAARKRAEEAAEAERRRLQEFQDMSDEQLDSEYIKAVEENDEGRMRDLVNEAARRKGYGDIQSDYQGVGAWAAPSNPGYESDEERREALQADGTDINVTDIAEGYSSQPGDYFTNLRAYGNDTPHGKESAKAINDALEEIRKGNNPKIKVYRAVPKSIKEGKMRNGDWVTPSRKYAEMHGDNRLEGDYRIIEQEVPANELWWDGNDLNEWGFDDGKGYAYRNTKNNRKLNDLITRDDEGNIIPLSQRFNARKSDVRYNKDGKRLLSAEEAAIRDAVVDRLRESGLEVITDVEEGQRVLDEANGRGERVRTQAMLDGLMKAANTIRSWIKGNKRGRVFTIELPESTQRKIKEAMGRDFDSHNITANGIAHALKNHGVGGNKLNNNSIPLREEDAELIPYIMTAPDYVKKASTDVSGRESVRFYKELSNGYVVVVEKEYKNSPDDMETITMWAETSSEATNARQEAVPDTHVQNAILSTDAAKIRKDAETAIENDGKIREQTRFFRTADGEAYGFTVGGKIYIDPRVATADTPIHEYAHLWASALRQGNQEEWRNVVGLMKGTPVWDEVKRKYPELTTDDEIADEVLATYSGRRGAERLKEEARKAASGKPVTEAARAVTAIGRVREALRKFWQNVADFLHIHYTNAEEVADRVMRDLVEGVNPAEVKSNNEKSDKVDDYTTNEEKANDLFRVVDDASEIEMSRNGNGALTDDDLANANDPVSKLLGKSTRTARQRREFAERERGRMVKRVQELAKTLHLDNVDIVTDASTLHGKRAKAKGFFSRSTGKITIVIPNHRDLQDVEQTLLHEAVAHYGLRQLFGEHFDTFIDNVYNNVSPELKQRIDAMSQEHGWSTRVATEEYLASLAENTNFEDMDASWWGKIKQFFLQMLHKIGFEGFTGVTLTDNELRYLLWRSYENLAEPGRYRSIVGEARDIAKQHELNVGNYNTTDDVISNAADRANEPNEADTQRMDEVNRRFNDELDALNEENADNVALSLGRPSVILRAAGVEDKLMKLYGNKVIKKMKKHGFLLDELRNLPEAVANPIAVFKNYGKEGNRSILTELKTEQGNFLVTLTLGEGHDVDFNVVTSVFGKGESNIIDWIKRGFATYINKEKALNYLHHSALKAVTSDNQELLSAANIVKNFENPSVESENVDDDVLYREAEEAEDNLQKNWREEYDRRTLNAAFKFREAAQDGMRSVSVLQDVISKETGSPIKEDENVWGLQNRLSSTNKYEQDYYYENYYKPLMREVGNLVKAGARYDELGRNMSEAEDDILKYLISKHGIERNAHFRDVAAVEARRPYEERIAEIRKSVEDGETTQEAADKQIDKLSEQANEAEEKSRIDTITRDYSGLSELYEDNMMFDTMAQEYVDNFESKFDTTELWNKINAATKATLQKTYESGLISRKQYEATRDMYEYYIPLRGWSNDVASEMYNYKGQQGVGGRIMKRAKGRKSLAENPLAVIGRMGQDGILQANKNKVKQRLYNLAVSHQTSLLSLKKQWYENVGTDENPEWERVYPELRADMSADEVSDAIEAFEGNMRELREDGRATQRREGLTLRYHTTSAQEQQHRVNVSIGGREYNIYVNGNPRAAQAINGELRMDEGDSSIVKRVNRWLANVYTSLNPEFVVTNYERDAGFAAAIVASTETPQYQAGWIKNMAKFNPLTTGVYINSLINKAMKGRVNPDNTTERYMQEFLANGGETGFTNMLTADDYKKLINKEIKNVNTGITAKKAARVFSGAVQRANRVFEDATRFATYVTSREQGRSIDEAIRDAKEISLNFNTRGADGMRNDGIVYKFFRNLRHWVIFTNPSIQGLNKAGVAFRNHPVRSTIAIAGLPVLLGYGMAAFASALLGDDDDEKVREAYMDLPKWVRRTNICIPIGGTKFVTIPLSYELRVSYGMGEMFWEIEQGLIEPSELAKETLTQISDLLPLSFASGTVAQNVSPTIVRPLVDIIQNKDFTGRPIWRENTFNQNMPEYTKAYAGTAKWFTKSAEVLNNAFPKFWIKDYPSPDKYTPGALDINPAIVEHLFDSYLGGLYTFPAKAAKTISMVWDEDMRDVRNIPFINRNLKDSRSGNPINRSAGNRYNTYMKEYRLTKQRWNGYRRETNHGVTDFLDKLINFGNTPQGQRMFIIDGYKKSLDEIDKQIKDMGQYEGYGGDEERKRLKNISDSLKQEMVNKLDSVSVVKD